MNLNLNSNQPSRNRLFIDVFVLSFSLFYYSQQELSRVNVSSFDGFVINTVAPIQKSVNSIYNNVSNFFNNYLANVNAAKRENDLVTQIESYKKVIFNFSETSKENDRLKKLLQFKEQLKYDSISAKIVAWDSSANFRTIRIDKGFSSGVKIQSPVISHNGVVGYVYRMSSHFSDVLTILDPNNRVDVIASRTRSHGIAEGYSGDSLIMKYLKITDPVALNDEIITSGLGYIYPKGSQSWKNCKY